MSLNLTDDEIHGLIAYARGKFASEPYPFGPTLRPIREALEGEPATETRALAATEAVCAEPNAAKEEQAAMLSGLSDSLLIRGDLLPRPSEQTILAGRLG